MEMFSNIIVGVNGRDGGRDATALAAALREAGARLTFAHVHVSDLIPGRGANADFDLAQDALASELVVRERNLWGHPADVRTIAAASVGDGLEQIASDREADLIVVGACERGAVGRVLAGDDAASVLHQAERAVAIAPRGYAASQHQIRKVGVAFDGSAESEIARTLAGRLAEGLGAELVARCVVTPHVFATGIAAGAAYMEDPEDVLSRTRTALGDRAATTEVVLGPIDSELGAFSEQVDLLVCGTRHNNVLRRVALGSTSAYLAHHAGCPLIVTGSSPAFGDDAPGHSPAAVA